MVVFFNGYFADASALVYSYPGGLKDAAELSEKVVLLVNGK